MDAIDRKIVVLLQEDASLSLAQIAHRVGLSQSPCWKRIQRLEKTGVILKRVALISPESIGVGLSVLTGIAAAGSGRGTTGKFYDFFPNSKKTGSLMAWAWVASRIVDGLIATTGHNIDVTKLYGLG